MATALHTQLKSHYVVAEDRHEVVVDKYRIDAIDKRGRLIEIQCASLAAIRDKIRCLVESHQVIVVKPLAARKRITTLNRHGGEIVSSRYSPARQTLPQLFKELVHFGIFPHPRLRLDVVMTEQEEIRIPPTSRSSWRKKYSVAERTLVEVQSEIQLQTAADLWKALDIQLGSLFTTADLVKASGMPPWLAQKAAFCFRRMEFFGVCGKHGNAITYQLTTRPRRAKAA